MVELKDLELRESSNKEHEYYWVIFCNDVRAGKVFIDKDSLGDFQLQIFLNKKHQGKGIGRIAYSLACQKSGHDKIYVHIRKGNIASIKSAEYAGFRKLDGRKGSQQVMIWNKF